MARSESRIVCRPRLLFWAGALFMDAVCLRGLGYVLSLWVAGAFRDARIWAVIGSALLLGFAGFCVYATLSVFLARVEATPAGVWYRSISGRRFHPWDAVEKAFVVEETRSAGHGITYTDPVLYLRAAGQDIPLSGFALTRVDDLYALVRERVGQAEMAARRGGGGSSRDE